jgi:transposase
LDEAHFTSKELHPKLAWGEIGETVTVFTNANLKGSYSLTILTRLDSNESTVVADIRHNTNTQWDFLRFCIYCIESGALQVNHLYFFVTLKLGDYLVLDNASVHVGSESWDLAITIFEAAGVHLCFLPTYSPELNAAEFVFHLVKDEVKRKRFQHENLWLHTITALAGITKEVMWGFYRKALFGWIKDLV